MPASRMRRITAFVLAVVMIVSCVLISGIDLSVKAAGSNTQTTDPSTLTAWTTDYGTSVTDTDRAGRVWVDKSVSDQSVTLSPEGGGSTTATIPLTGENNFLVGLSAISSSKSIVGQDTIPIDVMLVLDVSGSMNYTNNDAVQPLVQATNSAIQQLLTLNPNNRVGVVLFSGNTDFGNSTASTATVLLPLGRYTSSSGNFIQRTTRREDRETIETVSLVSGIRNEDGSTVSVQKKDVLGGTYIQNGVYQAWEQFANAENTEIDGTKKIPIMVFMGDGAPTAATTDYLSPGTSNVGDGGESGNTYAFLNQLTFSWVRKQMESTYGRTPLVYTLGLGLDSLGSEQQSSAKQVLNPSENTNQTLNEWWSSFTSLSSGQSLALSPWYDHDDRRHSVSVTKQNDGLTVSDRNYVDKYFGASNAGDLGDAFQSIIEEIYIQSLYYPTDVSGNGATLSGYLTFTDEIGEYMEVKKVSGLVYDNRLYTGSEFAKAIKEAEQGSPSAGDSVYFDEVIRSISSRLGITIGQAQNLIDTVYWDGQLYYNSDSDFNASFKWYADENQNYLGAYTSGGSRPANAKYLNESFLFSGEYTTVAGDNVPITTDLMYISTRISTDLATNNQTLTYSIPAALIPQVKYKVTIEGNSLEDATTADTERLGAYPMRLFYEVGASVDEDNIAFAVGNNSKYYDADTDTYTLYTNAWSEENGQITAETKVSFDPSQENEFYYYHKDTLIYSDQNGTLYTGGSQPTTGYYRQEVFTVGTNQTIDRHYGTITDTALTYAKQNDNGQWYIPKGTPKYQNIIQTVSKNPNSTNTAGYVLDPNLQPNLDNPGNYHIEAYLGNNGTITLQQNRGALEISKEVTGNRGEQNKDFSFTLTLTQPDGTTALTESFAFSKSLTDGTSQTGIIKSGETFTLKHGESISISGIPVGAVYTVTENNTGIEEYTTKVNGQDSQNRTASGNIVEDFLPDTPAVMDPTTAEFVNDWTVADTPFSFTKVDGSAAQGDDPLANPLEGAQFRLYRLDCTNPGTAGHDHENELIENAEAADNGCWTYIDTKMSSKDTGLVDFGELPTGTYRLVETKAPDGFQLPKGQWNIVVYAGEEADPSDDSIEIEAVDPVSSPAFGETESGMFYIQNYKLINLPLTGGQSHSVFLLAGGIFLIGSGILFVFRYRLTSRKRF